MAKHYARQCEVCSQRGVIFRSVGVDGLSLCKPCWLVEPSAGYKDLVWFQRTVTGDLLSVPTEVARELTIINRMWNRHDTRHRETRPN